MKYFLFETVDYVDGTKSSVGVYTYETPTDLMQAYHQKMAGAMKNTNYKREQLKGFDSLNNEIVNDIFVRDIPEPEPEVEPTEEVTEA